MADRPVSRPCPHDFEQMFVEIGRLACEEHYHAWRDTITRWMRECGEDRLKSLRANHVRSRRPRKSRRPLRRSEQRQGAVSFTLARHAAHHLRKVRNGGFIVSPAQSGEWWVGSRRRSAGELLELAISKGFDPANLRDEGTCRLECAAKP